MKKASEVVNTRWKDYVAEHGFTSPKLIIDSEKKQPEVFLEPSQLMQKIKGVGNLSRIYVIVAQPV
jgi:hypothetical protein